MKYKLMIAAFLAGTTLAQAKLIDVVSFTSGLPDEYRTFLRLINQRPLYFFDEARSRPYEIFGTPYEPGWVSQFGRLDGGEYFDTDLFAGAPPSSAAVSWDFAGTGYFMRYLDLWGQDEDGTYWTHLYKVPFKFQFQDTVDLVQLNPQGTGQIVSIAFYGNSVFNLPETVPTACLLGLSLVSLASLKRFSS